MAAKPFSEPLTQAHRDRCAGRVRGSSVLVPLRAPATGSAFDDQSCRKGANRWLDNRRTPQPYSDLPVVCQNSVAKTGRWPSVEWPAGFETLHYSMDG